MTHGIWTFDPPNLLAKTESVGSATVEPEEGSASVEYNELFSYDDHVATNKKNYEQLHPRRVPIESMPGKFCLSYPPASKIPSNCVHPAFYMKVVGITSLDELASAGHLNAPVDWKQRIDAALETNYVSPTLNLFRSSVGFAEVIITWKSFIHI
jgi:hypothetical protein